MSLRWIALTAVIALAACNDRPTPPRPRAVVQPSELGDEGRTPAVIRRDGNHLLGQPSPYLAQHAHNPVDWYPWGPEALERARAENRPIFLSIGYSTCHWCHVMEEESFENDAVATYLNAHFIAIKVDREQRPDIDALYIEAVGRLGGSTGWPLSVFLTPNLVPFFGGTYFPPTSQPGRPSFTDVLQTVRERYASEGDGVEARGRAIFASIEASSRERGGAGEPLSAALLELAFQRLTRSHDPMYGGFGGRQKFPNAPLLLAELRYVERTGDADIEAHLRLTLEQAMRGGIRDHMAGTFHRYAVDRIWHVPHFEKMLYDNAQLAQVYVEAGRLFHDPRLTAVGRAVLDDLVATWQRPDGGFVVGFDADDPGGEGYYYTFTPGELTAALGAADATRFATLFGVRAGGERLLEGRSVLHRIEDDDVRERLGMSPEEADAFAEAAFARLRPVRADREPPATDDKELAAWNGLAILSLAEVGRWLEEPRYVAAAQRAARFIEEHCWDAASQTMLRGRRQGESLGEGFLDDYALPLIGLLQLHAADGDERWLLLARQIGDAIVTRFHDASLRSFHQTARADTPEGLPLRRPDHSDGVIPSPSNAATMALLALGAVTGDREMRSLAEAAARASAPLAAQNPGGSGYLLVVLDHLLGPSREVVIAGAPDDERTAALWSVVRPTVSSRILPLRLPAAGASDALIAGYAALRGKTAQADAPTAYVCEVGRCQLPTADPRVLFRQLDPVGLPAALRR